MEPLAIIFAMMAFAYVCYLLGRLRFMMMPITVGEEEGTKIVAMIDKSLRKYGLEVSCKGKDYFTISRLNHGYGLNDTRFFCMLYKNNFKTYSEWLKYRKSKDKYFFIVKVDEYPLWKQKEFARIRSLEEFIKQVPTFETKLNKMKKLEAIKNICKEDV
jgi:hypothetical protein